MGWFFADKPKVQKTEINGYNGRRIRVTTTSRDGRGRLRQKSHVVKGATKDIARKKADTLASAQATIHQAEDQGDKGW